MWLTTPETIENVLWKGALEPASDGALERLQQEWAARGVERGAADAVRDLPAISIGRPETWPLAEVYPPATMPPLLKAKLDEADFYLVRLGCSFRARREHSQVEWARFVVHLLPDGAGRQPIGFDLHPLMVTQEVKRNVKVSLSPSLAFAEVEAGLGGLEFGFEYAELQPIISASGVGEPAPDWTYEEAKGVMVQGGKWMHLLLKAPKGMAPIDATLDLAADVRVRDSILAVLAISDPRRAREELRVRLVEA